MRPLLFQNLKGLIHKIIYNHVWCVTHLNEGEVQFVDVRLLFPHSGLIRCHLDGDSNNEITDSYTRR